MNIKYQKLDIKNKKTMSGFTLIEVLVAMTIFAFIITAIGSVFVQALRIQRRAFLFQRLQENINFVAEGIAREVRVGVIGSSDCLLPESCDSLQIDHPVNGAITYGISSGQITRNGSAMTESGIEVDKLSFYVEGNTAGSQPKVTLVIGAQASDADQILQFQTQTTLSQRNLNE